MDVVGNLGRGLANNSDLVVDNVPSNSGILSNMNIDQEIYKYKRNNDKKMIKNNE